MTSTNRWCERLGVEPPGLAPGGRFEHLAPSELLIVALLDRGAPMTLDEIVAAVRVARPLELPQGLRTRLMKSWGGRDPVRKDAEERYTLHLGAWRWPSILRQLGLVATGAPPPPPPPDPVPAPLPLDQPLSLEEIEFAFGRYGVRPPMSGVRVAAAVLEAVGRPMTVDEILAALPETARPPAPGALSPAPSPRSRPPLVVADPDGRLRLVLESSDRIVVRRLVRRLAFVMRSRQELETLIDRSRVQAKVDDARRRADAKVDWKGFVFSVEPRIRLTRSHDQRSHSYLGYCCDSMAPRAAPRGRSRSRSALLHKRCTRFARETTSRAGARASRTRTPSRPTSTVRTASRCSPAARCLRRRGRRFRVSRRRSRSIAPADTEGSRRRDGRRNAWGACGAARWPWT